MYMVGTALLAGAVGVLSGCKSTSRVNLGWTPTVYTKERTNAIYEADAAYVAGQFSAARAPDAAAARSNLAASAEGLAKSGQESAGIHRDSVRINAQRRKSSDRVQPLFDLLNQ